MVVIFDIWPLGCVLFDLDVSLFLFYFWMKEGAVTLYSRGPPPPVTLYRLQRFNFNTRSITRIHTNYTTSCNDLMT